MGGRVTSFSGLGLRRGQLHQRVQLACGRPMPGRPDRHQVTRRRRGIQRGKRKDIVRDGLQQSQRRIPPFRGEFRCPAQSCIPSWSDVVQQGDEVMAKAVAQVTGVGVGRVLSPCNARPVQDGNQDRAGQAEEGPPDGVPPFRGPGVHAPPGNGPGAPDEVQQSGFPLVVGMVAGQQHVAFPEHLGEPAIPRFPRGRLQPEAGRLSTVLQAFHNVGLESTPERSGSGFHELPVRVGCFAKPVVDVQDGHLGRHGAGGMQQGHGVRTAGHSHSDRMRFGQAVLRKQGPQGIGQGGPVSGHPQARSQIPRLPRHRGHPGRPGP